MDKFQSDVPRLRWVTVNDELCNVSTFSELSPKDRPVAHCPICEKQVTLKLGQKRAHHFAHRPEDICPATKPETAIHLNCKFHIFSQLRSARALHISTKCKSCGQTKPVLWKCDWDNVQVEYRVDSLRPDIVLLQNGAVIGAIEIWVTHAVDKEKALKLQQMAVDWIELNGHEGIYEAPHPWTVNMPLDVIQQHPSPPEWICNHCKTRKAREQSKIDNRVEVRFAQMIDMYFYSGKKYRNVYYVKYAYKNGDISHMWIEDRNRTIIAKERAPLTKEGQSRLNNAFYLHLQECKKKSAIIDDSMGWIEWIPGKKFVAKDIDNFPFRYEWQADKHQWLQRPDLKWKKLK